MVLCEIVYTGVKTSTKRVEDVVGGRSAGRRLEKRDLSWMTRESAESLLLRRPLRYSNRIRGHSEILRSRGVNTDWYLDFIDYSPPLPHLLWV